MAKKVAKKFTMSRAKLSKKLDEIVDRLSELDLGDTTPNDLDSFLSELSNDLSDLSITVNDEA